MGLFAKKGSDVLFRKAAIARMQASHARKTVGRVEMFTDLLDDATLEVIYGQEGVGLGTVKLSTITASLNPQGQTGEDILKYARDATLEAAKQAEKEGFNDASRHFLKAMASYQTLLSLLGIS